MALGPFRSVRLARRLEELTDLSATEGFIVSRLAAGEQPVEDLLSMCPIPWQTVLTSLAGLVERRILAVRDLRGGESAGAPT